MTRAPTPFERLIAQRPDPEELEGYRREDRARPLVITRWDPASTDDMLHWYLGPELSRDADEFRQIVLLDSDYVGTMTVILRIRPGEWVPGLGEGHCDLGIILSSEDYYDFGADLAALRAAGVMLSWEAAQWVHAAGREQLFERHARGEVGNLTPRKIRLNLFHRPTPEDTAANDDIPPPAFAFESSRGADPATELAVFARAILTLTQHPDPRIDQLLRDPDSRDDRFLSDPYARDVLRDLLLERGGPVEPLLGDAAELELDWLPPPPDADIDDELEALWNKVLELDPMIDTSDPAIFELPGPAIDLDD